MQTDSILIDRLMGAGAVVQVSDENGFDGYRIDDVEGFACSVIAEVAGDDKRVDSKQVKRVVDAAVQFLTYDDMAAFWVDTDVYYADDLTFLDAAVRAI